MGGIRDDRLLVVRDYFHAEGSWDLAQALASLDELETEELLDLRTLAKAIHLVGGEVDPDASMQARGYRLLARVPRLSESLTDRIVDQFGNLQKIMRATPSELAAVAGIGEARARAVKESLARLAESSILDRYS